VRVPAAGFLRLCVLSQDSSPCEIRRPIFKPARFRSQGPTDLVSRPVPAGIGVLCNRSRQVGR
jgi:hypothetical protein